MPKELIFSIISTIIYLIGVIPYWKDVLKWRTTPHPFSFGVWAVANFFNSYVLLINEQYYALVPSLFMSCIALMSLVVGIFRFDKIRINWFDWLCLILSISLFILYFASENILLTIIFSIFIDLVAFLPTFKKWWMQPWTESILMYSLAGVNQIFTLLSMVQANSDSQLFWIYIFISNTFYFLMVFFRRWYLKGWKSIFE